MKKLSIIIILVLALAMTIVPTTFAEEGQPVNLYDTAEDGALLYTADFSGTDEKYPFHRIVYTQEEEQAGEYECGWKWESKYFSATVNPENKYSATFENVGEEGTGKTYNSAWGAYVEGLPLGVGYNYTIKLTVTRTGNTPIGLLFDGLHGGYFYALKGRMQRNGNALKDAAGNSYSYVTFKDVNGTEPSVDQPSVQNFALEITQTATEAVYYIYVQQASGLWALLDSGSPQNSGITWNSDTLGLFFYDYHLTKVDVSDVKVYKGVEVLENENNLILGDDETNDEETTDEDITELVTKKERATYAPPELITEPTKQTEDTVIAEKNGGCKSSFGIVGAFFIVATMSSMSVAFARRKKDE